MPNTGNQPTIINDLLQVEMMEKLTSLTFLRSFEAAARHMNFSKAGRELGVTPAAISNHIKLIEEVVGVPLFWRTSRTMRLTHQGTTLLGATEEALLLLDRAVARITDPRRAATLRLTTTPSFAAKWLVPRLPRFRALDPNVEIRIDVSERVVDLSDGEADVSIRFGNGHYPGMHADRLFREAVFPVCSPSLLEATPLRRPADLKNHTLIHLDWQAQHDTWPDWRMWLLAAAVDGIDLDRGIHFSQTTFVLQAAIEGQGVALGNTSLVKDDLAAGRLVQPFGLSLPIAPDFAYYLVTPKRKAEMPAIASFRAWMLSEV